MPCVLKRIFLLLLLFVAIGAAAFYVLYLHRTPLPPAHAPAIPSIAEAPGLSACSIETGRSFSPFSVGVTAGSILVRRPVISSSTPATPAISPWTSASIHSGSGRSSNSLRDHQDPDVPLPEMLRHGREDPAEAALGDLSHVHLDQRAA